MASLRTQLDALMTIDPMESEMEFQQTWFSWGALHRGMKSLDSLLTIARLGRDARIAVVLRNRPELACALLDTLASERCLVTLNPMYPDDKLAADTASVAAPAVVASIQDWERPGFAQAVRDTGALGIEGSTTSGSCTFRLREIGDPSKWTRINAPDIAIEMLTSGTTGAPKRIPLPRKRFEAAVADWSLFEKGRQGDAAPRLRNGVQVVHASMAHIGGVGGLINAILSGRKVCLLERFTVLDFHDAVLRHRPLAGNGPPTVLRMLLDAKIPPEDLSSLKAFRVGSAPLDPALGDAFYATYGIPVLQNYGATEFAGGVAGWTLSDFHALHASKRGSVGRLNPGMSGRTVDPETGQAQPPGIEGVLELRSTNLAQDGQWVRTTDLAVVDEDGFLFLRGRSDNAIIRGGFKIAPDEVVRALEQHSDVKEAAVVGIKDPRLGQVPVAAMTLRAGSAEPSIEAFEAFLRERLLPYQVPVRFQFVAELPRTASMKVDASALKALFVQQP